MIHKLEESTVVDSIPLCTGYASKCVPKIIGLLIALLVLAVATDSRANPITTTFTSHTATGVFNNDGGWFGFDQYDVTVSVTAIVDDPPTEHLHYKLF
jgi:hypothetical protein